MHFFRRHNNTDQNVLNTNNIFELSCDENIDSNVENSDSNVDNSDSNVDNIDGNVDNLKNNIDNKETGIRLLSHLLITLEAQHFVSLKAIETIVTSQKLNINGSKLVLEKDGTEIIENEVLLILKDECLILLEEGENWIPMAVSDISETESNSTNTSTSTLQGNTCSDSIIINNLPIDVIECDSNKENEQVDFNNSLLYVISNEKPLVSESFWQNFEIPWAKFPEYMINSLESGKAERQITVEVIHTILNEMRSVKTQIPNMAYRCVARKMADKFPLIFLDKDEDGTVLGNGTHSTVCRLQDRCNYLNRCKKRPGTKLPPQHLKKMAGSRAGCSNWQPPESNKSVDIPHIKKLLFSIDETDPNFFEYLDQTYYDQRTFLNSPNPPTMSTIKNEWPVLFKTEAIIWHFHKLTGAECTDLDFKNKCQKVLKLKKSPETEHINDDNKEDIIQALYVASSHFKEELSSFIFKCNNIPEQPDEDDNFMDLIPCFEPCIMEISKVT
ncbi:unnamed protein product [Brassicogethes aeneus]|uniref:CIDE-N domain-containing protein n=1 Tax=Brassicogethes aeneus TaxID=1431903 RepID=A0A9P0B1B1_BRAAE|nr:unnamed protein product [Brassicogethes aeneus]